MNKSISNINNIYVITSAFHKYILQIIILLLKLFRKSLFKFPVDRYFTEYKDDDKIHSFYIMFPKLTRYVK